MHKLLRQIRPYHALSRGRVSVVCALLISGAIACNTDSTMPAPVDVSTLHWRARVTYPVIQLSMAPGYDTVQLEALVYTPDNSLWQNTDPNTVITTSWRSSDSLSVQVSPTGFVTALKTTLPDGVSLYVTKQIDGISHLDTARVHVSNLTNPPVIDSFRYRPTDSTKRAANALLQITLPAPVIKDTANRPVTGIPVAFIALNTRHVWYANKWRNSLACKTVIPNKTMVIASTYAYGVARADTFELEIGGTLSYLAGFPSVKQTVIEGNKSIMGLPINTHTLGPGGTLQWENASAIRPASFTGELLPGENIDVIFDDTTGIAAAATNSGSGNIIGIPSDNTLPARSRQRDRKFTRPGIYRYTIMPYGFKGTVQVYDR